MLSLPVDAYDSAHETLTDGFKTTAGRNRTVTLSPKIQPIIKRLRRISAPCFSARFCASYEHEKIIWKNKK